MKEYNFYGWEQADAPAVNDIYNGISTPRDLYDALSDIWCEYTCAPRLRKEWSSDNKTLGQCSITAFLVQDIFGGEVYGVLRPGGNYHCYNVVDDKKFDLTSEQFGDEVLCYEDNPIQTREAHFAKEEKRLRYEYLKNELLKQTKIKKSEHTTLCYIIKDGKVLMMLRNKKKQDINKNKWIGVGGHFKHGESPEECLLREVEEETGLVLTSYKVRGIVTFCYKDVVEYMHLYTAGQYEGELSDCDEGELSWIDKDKVMDLNIWEGDRIFLKLLLEDAGYFSLKLIYDDEGRLVDKELVVY
ncbi:MAG: 8-oxo-dGTP diphosphatase [Lachnospiraceae bacterium]|nr:8-oxo-dGTP diphosphatase [Lachnospiraceae bacterium]